VNVATVIQKDVPVQLRVVGNMEAYLRVSIRALVEGQYGKSILKKARTCQKDNLLLSIDPRPFEAASDRPRRIWKGIKPGAAGRSEP